MRKVAILAANGTLDAAYKVFNIATAAASMDAAVTIFFTFEGLKLILNDANGNLPAPPAMERARGKLPPIPELVDLARELGVTFIACQMTMDMMGVGPEQIAEGTETGGAASFLASAFDADVTLSF